jgi:hypothetical protein
MALNYSFLSVGQQSAFPGPIASAKNATQALHCKLAAEEEPVRLEILCANTFSTSIIDLDGS